MADCSSISEVSGHGQRRQKRGSPWLKRPLFITLFFVILSVLKSELTARNLVHDHNSKIDLPSTHTEDVEEELLRVPHRYYIYNLSEDFLIKSNYPGCETVWSMYKALQTHPLRTLNPNEATFFLIPVFSCCVGQKGYLRTKFFQAMEVVTASGIYQSTLGSRHILIENGGWPYNWQIVTGLQNSIKHFEPEWTKNFSQPGSWWTKNYSRWQNDANATCNGILIHCITSVFKNCILAFERDGWALRKMHLNNI